MISLEIIDWFVWVMVVAFLFGLVRAAIKRDSAEE